MNYKLISISQKEEWIHYVNRSLKHDFYHTWHYHSFVLADDPFLFIYEEEGTFIILPLLMRKVKGSDFFDCTSVYGYAGPISNMCFSTLSSKTVNKFKAAFLGFLKSKRIICVFSCLHPMMDQQSLLNIFGGICNSGKTVAIDLQTSLEVQRMKYRRAIRSKIRQLREQGFTVKEATTKGEIQEFVRMYRANMMKVNASSYYYFEEKYFFELLDSLEFDSKLLLTYYNGEITAGALVTFSDHIMQLHLVATKNKYLQHSPMKLLIEEASIVGREQGMHFLHLGGGVGGKEDSLFRFKSGFSDLFLPFQTWQFVADEIVYKTLARERFNRNDEQYDKFPLYRSG